MVLILILMSVLILIHDIVIAYAVYRYFKAEKEVKTTPMAKKYKTEEGLYASRKNR